NGMVYNRCVGTRYCANNCVYKVRRFNYFDYGHDNWPGLLSLMLNPDVTVRGQGVMEKCTFCVQRIRGAQHQARVEDRPVADGDVRTACQQTCPADAIAFGNLTDPASRVAQVAAAERGYRVLDGLNTKPAVTYLMKVRNVVEG
ncbi:MAG: 4Fe-4S dicluster domain-containing protein, partial [Gemmatimonadota bacterium]|nr:4Fe-4S dicluster domain-containing protein [Gemmatimonadota bacterium]